MTIQIIDIKVEVDAICVPKKFMKKYNYYRPAYFKCHVYAYLHIRLAHKRFFRILHLDILSHWALLLDIYDV